MPEHSTLSELFDKFNVSSVTQGTTREKCRTAWQVLVSLLGPDFPADQVNAQHIDRLQRYMRDEAVTRRGRGYSECSVFSYAAAIGQVFHWAFDARHLPANPVTGCHRIKPTKKKVHVYTREEIADMLDTVRGNPDKRIVALAWPDAAGVLRWTGSLLIGLAGLRVGEMWNLRWDDIDLDRGLIHVQSRPDYPGEYWRWTAKGKADRLVPICDELWAVLCRLRTVAAWRYPFLKQRRCLALQAKVGRLTETERKYPYNNFHLELRWIQVVTSNRRQAAGLDRISSGSYHTFRKNAATQLAEQGVPSHFCQEILGHATDRLTKEVYTYVDQRKCLEESRRAFNAASW
ncbi:MAG: site-specific integrase [Phycisphaerales bacterium]